MRRFLLTFLAVSLVLSVQAQDDSKWSFSGYVKNMQSVLSFNDSYYDVAQAQFTDTLLLEELIHQRLNVEWAISDKLTFKTSCRNRLIIGDLVRFTPDYTAALDDGVNDYFDMAVSPIDKGSMVWHSAIDRFYLEYYSGNWEIKAGRQRINWGINTLWNPNDLFNAYSFTDFDYEERPGSDAIRVKYYTGFASSVEIAANVAFVDSVQSGTVAALWKFNKKNYDFQVLGAYSKEDIVLGGGWAGSIKNAGFKGEFSYFSPLVDGVEANFTAAISGDYSFKNSLYLQTGLLYNYLGKNSSSSSLGILGYELSARNLYPYQYTVFLQGAYPISPLMNSGLSVIYSPSEEQLFFLNPYLTYSILENWDIDLVGQIIFSDNGEKYNSPIQAFFLRVKYSY